MIMLRPVHDPRQHPIESRTAMALDSAIEWPGMATDNRPVNAHEWPSNRPRIGRGFARPNAAEWQAEPEPIGPGPRGPSRSPRAAGAEPEPERGPELAEPEGAEPEGAAVRGLSVVLSAAEGFSGRADRGGPLSATVGNPYTSHCTTGRRKRRKRRFAGQSRSAERRNERRKLPAERR